MRTRARIGDEDEPNAKLEKKKGRVVLYTYTFKRECIARVCVCVCDCDGECVQRSVSSCRAWSGRERRAVSAPHPESPSKPTPPTVTNPPPPHYSSLASPSSTADPLSPCAAVFLSPIFRSTLYRNPCAPERRVEGKMGKTRVGEIRCKFLLVDVYVRKFDYFAFNGYLFVPARMFGPRLEKNGSL